jgi:hypothetical protein
MRSTLSILLLAVLLAMPLGLHAQRAEQALSDPAFLWTAGQLDPTDNSVYYSLYVATGDEIINDLTITGAVPEGATFVKEFWQPDSATFVGEANGNVTWTMDALGRDSVAGPFTFQVTFENADAEDFAPPGFITGSLTWNGGALSAVSYAAETLSPVEDSGSVTIEPSGTLDAIPVGNTGAWILVPEGAVSEAVTLTLTRLPVTDATALPEVDFETWWCGQYSLTADKEVTFSQPILLMLPILRALTPFAEIPVFGMAEGGEWSVLSDGVAETVEGETALATISQSGLEALVTLNAASFGSTPQIFAVGIDTTKRAVSTTSGVKRTEEEAPWL